MEGTAVRLSGQDSRRGTFSQRHATLYDARTGERYFPLQHLAPNQATFSCYDSLLSEAPAAVRSWKENFQKIRRWFFTFYGLFIAMSAVREILLLGRPLLGVASGFDVITILNVTAGAIWRNRRVQIAVLSLELLIAFLVSAQRFYAAR